MLRRAIQYNKTSIRFNSGSITGLTKPELKQNPAVTQAPNRGETWTRSQESRLNIFTRFAHRFIQKNLEEQPRPHSAMELIAKQPVRYISGNNIAVCDGNRGSTLQGHPKVFINLDKPMASTCGYCGLRYAKEEHRHLIEKE